MRDGSVLSGSDATVSYGVAAADIPGRLARAAIAIALGGLLAMTADPRAPLLVTMIVLLAGATALLAARGLRRGRAGYADVTPLPTWPPTLEG